LELLPCVLIGRSALLTGGPARINEATEQCLMESNALVRAWAWLFKLAMKVSSYCSDAPMVMSLMCGCV